ncbi:MAG: hypothetical protein ACI87W_003021 [Halieaceae bacterium]|jgi:hypothetical protein
MMPDKHGAGFCYARRMVTTLVATLVTTALRRYYRLASLCLLLALPTTELWAAHPNNSIAPRPPPPTEYGLHLHRADDKRYVENREISLMDIRPIDVSAQQRALEGLDSFSPAAIPPLREMGEAYRSAGRYASALEHFQHVAHLQRLNSGLNSPSQMPVMDEIFEAQVALGRLDLADGTREYLLRVQQRNDLDPEDRFRALKRYSDWKRQLYLAGEGYETYAYLMAMYYSHNSELDRLESIDRNHPAQVEHLYERLRLEYLISRYDGEKKPPIQMYSSGGLGGDYTLHTDLAAEEFRVLRKHNYRNGRLTAERIVKILETQPQADVRVLARARIAEGDWHMWSDQKARALDAYRKAYRLYANDGDDTTDPEELFAQPVELPADDVFYSDGVVALSERPAVATARFEVSRMGKPREVNIESLEPIGSRGARSALYRMLKRMRFRPALRGGDAVDQEDVVRKYQFDF